MSEDSKYKNFETYLKKYTGQKINCLIVGAYTGDYSCWLLNNLCTNHFSRVFSLDNWIDPVIENKFNTNIESTNKIDYHVKLNMNLTKGLVRLEKIKYVIFDIIIINTKNEDKDIISNSIIAWNLLNENGIMIFDNYRDTYEEEEFIPKISINSFIIMYKEQYNRLTSNYQLIIKKKSNITSKVKEQEIINIINNYNFESLYIKLDENIEEELEFRLANIELDSEIVGINEKINEIISFNLLYKEIYINPIYKNIYINLKYYINKFNINIYDTFNIKYKFNDLYNIFEKYNTKYKHIFINNNELDKQKFNFIFDNIKFNHNFHISFNNLDISEKTYTDVINTLKKYDLIYSRIYTSDSTHKNYIYYQIGLAINIQEINGDFILHIPIHKINSINILIELIYFLKKYYNKIKIINRQATIIGGYILLLCLNFKQINNKLIDFNKIIILLNNNNEINSIIDIKSNKFKLMKKKIYLYFLKYFSSIIKLNYKYKNIINLKNESYLKLFTQRLLYLHIINSKLKLI